MGLSKALVIIVSVIGAYFGFRQVRIAFQQQRIARQQDLQKTSKTARVPSQHDEPLPKPQPPRVRTRSIVERLDKAGRPLIDHIVSALAQNNMVCIWGSGGVGKTTLATLVANRLMSHVYDGVVWVGLDTQGNVDFAQILNVISVTLLRQDSYSLSTSSKKALVKNLLSKGNYLIVVDNFEVVTPEDKKPLISFLKEAPSSSLILSIEYVEQILTVEIPAMRPEEAKMLARILCEQTLERNRGDNIDVKRVVEITEGNPLLIEWVVSQIQFGAYAPSALDTLFVGTAEPSQSIFQRSFSLLSDKAREVLLILALFQAEVYAPTVGRILGIDSERDLGACLTELRKLRFIDQMASVEPILLRGLTRRLVMLYLQSGANCSDLKLKFILFYLNSIATSTITFLETEKDNIIGAMQLAVQLKLNAETLRFYDSISAFLWVHGFWDDYITCLEYALSATTGQGMDEKNAIILSELGWVYIERDEYLRGIELITRSLQVFEELENNDRYPFISLPIHSSISPPTYE
jgi:energy-coupling factor transporter ATP-binding protein EcfA2